MQNIEFGIDCDSRVALVGPNGAGGLSANPHIWHPKASCLLYIMPECQPQVQ